MWLPIPLGGGVPLAGALSVTAAPRATVDVTAAPRATVDVTAAPRATVDLTAE